MATNPTTNAGRHTTHRRPSNNTFSPVLSSPLSPRTSIATAATTGSSSGAMLPSPPRSPILQKPVRRRAYKPIPSPTAESRRSLFLKKVQNAREEKAWQARGGQDEIMRMIFVAEQKRWRASLEMAARMIPTIREEEEDEIREAANGHAQPEELPEELLMEEQEQTGMRVLHLLDETAND